MWKFVKTGVDGNCELFGVNIFDYDWKRINQKVNVIDPLYNQKHEFNVYNANINGTIVTFAAGEFSNCIFGFYVRE